MPGGRYQIGSPGFRRIISQHRNRNMKRGRSGGRRNWPSHSGINVRKGGYMRQETKFVDTERSTALGSASSWTSLVIADDSLNQTTQGTGVSQRNGRRTWGKQLTLSGHVIFQHQSNASTAVAYGNGSCSPYVRIVLFVDKQSNQAAPGFNDIMTKTVVRSVGLRDLEHSDRYRVLADFKVHRKSIGAATEGTLNISTSEVVYFSKHVSLKNMVTLYDGNGGTVADIVSNGINIMACPSTFTTSQVEHTVELNARYTFQG